MPFPGTGRVEICKWPAAHAKIGDREGSSSAFSFAILSQKLILYAIIPGFNIRQRVPIFLETRRSYLSARRNQRCQYTNLGATNVKRPSSCWSFPLMVTADLNVRPAVIMTRAGLCHVFRAVPLVPARI